MELKDFIGKEVVDASTKEHYIIDKLDGVGIHVRTIKQNKYGTYSHFVWKTGTAAFDNAIVKGELVFVDEALFEPFKNIYEQYQRTDGRWDAYVYNMTHFD
jgi:hypothetical protein